jgi:hypothetical protein
VEPAPPQARLGCHAFNLSHHRVPPIVHGVVYSWTRASGRGFKYRKDP